MASSRASEDAISLDEALRLCEAARSPGRLHWWTAARWQCWGCLRFSREPAGRCFSSKTGNVGCGLVNAERRRATG